MGKNQGLVVALCLIAVAVLFFALQANDSGKSQDIAKSGEPAGPLPEEEPVVREEGPDKIWAVISKDNVETVCLLQAKKFAGANAWAVGGCNCSAQEGTERKYYSCLVSALDGSHPLTIDCAKQVQSCMVNSEQGYVQLTFVQLAGMAK